MGVTINDVAKRAGVSHTTVSWTIHDHPGITDETKARVFKAIEELDYHPNYFARSLVKGKTNTIAVVSNFFSSPFEMEVLKGIEQSIHQEKVPHSLNLFSTQDNSEKVLKEIVYGKRADAAILLSVSPSSEVCELFAKNGMPLVVIDEAATNAITINVDNFLGANIATEYLIKKGRKKIGLILGSNAGDLGLSQNERKRGYLHALENNAIPFEPELVFYIEDYYFEEGQIIFKRILKKKIDIDSLFCAAGDIIAMGFILEAKNNNFNLPEQLSVVGYDDIPFSALVSPSLTTIKQPLTLIGKRSYEEVIKALETGIIENKVITFEPQLVIRNSV